MLKWRTGATQRSQCLIVSDEWSLWCWHSTMTMLVRLWYRQSLFSSIIEYRLQISSRDINKTLSNTFCMSYLVTYVFSHIGYPMSIYHMTHYNRCLTWCLLSVNRLTWISSRILLNIKNINWHCFNTILLKQRLIQWHQHPLISCEHLHIERMMYQDRVYQVQNI